MPRIPKIIISQLFCLCFLMTSLKANSEEFVIGVEDIPYYPLYDFANNKPSFTSELLEEFGRQYGHTFKFLPLPIKRFERWLIENEIDFKYPDNVRWFSDRSIHKQLTFSDSTLELVAGTLTRANSDMSEQDFKVLGTVLGFYPSMWIEQIKQGKVILFEHPSAMVLVRQVLEGQIDGINLDLSVVNYYLTKLKRPGEIKINMNFERQIYSYQLSTIKHKKVIKQFNQFLANNQTFIQSLKDKFAIIDHKLYMK